MRKSLHSTVHMCSYRSMLNKWSESQCGVWNNSQRHVQSEQHPGDTELASLQLIHCAEFGWPKGSVQCVVCSMWDCTMFYFKAKAETGTKINCWLEADLCQEVTYASMFLSIKVFPSFCNFNIYETKLLPPGYSMACWVIRRGKMFPIGSCRV